MWIKISGFFRKIIDYIEYLLGNKPHIPPNVDDEDIHKEAQPDSKTTDKPLAFPITAKYEQIDWENNPPQYRKRKGVLTYQERNFYGLLRSILGPKYQILSMVRMADVMYLSNETEDYKYHKNNILCKHFDYVICDRDTFEPKLIIELDDPKHQYIFRKQIDDFKDNACQEAGLPILRKKVQQKYNRQKLSQQIHQILSSDPLNPYSNRTSAPTS